ncbi:MAG: hypothetical protein ONB51_05755 [candidate division KSB1 bacterium]|nr:hypothetical protein [candidate division KSB1 bacterium]MDZ7306996.1 hypothetical protein [candidate division KSB1 bacterium]MDZ7354052.1 hypothetical protein [candidate division KSB1 bacterium]MDZ7408731.1 hypothetical protein [candidate division KSB1 bacterium]MDZ7416724.1 hypothetical protein [candidate division KSB1 bacterium]
MSECARPCLRLPRAVDKTQNNLKFFNQRLQGISRLLLGGSSSIFGRVCEVELQADERRGAAHHANLCCCTHAHVPSSQKTGRKYPTPLPQAKYRPLRTIEESILPWIFFGAVSF